MANKTRVIITSFGIFLGVASLLVNLSFIRAMDMDLKRKLAQMGGVNLITVDKLKPDNYKQTLKFRLSPGLTMEDGVSLVNSIPAITGVLRNKGFGWKPIFAKGKTTWCRITAVDQHHFENYNYAALYGRLISSEEFGHGDEVCMIGVRRAMRLFGRPETAIDKTVKFQGLLLKIVGVIKTKSNRERRASELLFPYRLYELRIGGKYNEVDKFMLIMKDGSDVRHVSQKIKSELRVLHRGVEDFELEINIDKIKETKIASLGMKILLYCIAGISLLVGGVSIMNIMFATIGDRIREIGIRKSLGARRVDIFVQFIIEAMVVCIVGGLPGMFLGAIIDFAPEKLFPMNPTLFFSDYFLAFGFTIISGFLSGFFPALKAANMQPVEALQY